MRDFVTPEIIYKIESWPAKDFHGVMEYMRSLWEWPVMFRTIPGGYCISTGGYSEHEAMVSALQNNKLWWSMFWHASLRGGHFEFRDVFAKGEAGAPRPFKGWEDGGLPAG